ncbi:MAG: hypothetical protein ACRD2J_06775 [Thermoanaerobaculia bacterium]
MARQKISSVIDAELFRRAKIEAVRQDRPLADLLAEALERYLADRGAPRGEGSVVGRTWASIEASPSVVRRVLDEEESLLDS